MKGLKKIFSAIFSVYAFLVFIVFMLLLFPFIFIVSFFGKIKGGNLVYKLCRLWADLFMIFTGIYHKNIFEAEKAKDHAAVFVFNHISYMDIPVLLKAFRKQPIRILAKADLAKTPIFGFIYRKATIMVNRESTDARAKSVKELQEALRKNISIVLAPEGTFNTTHHALKSFYDGAFKVAIETQTAIQPVLFLDTYHRLNYRSIFSFTPGRSRAVFLDEITVKNFTLQNVNELKDIVYKQMEAALIRYKAAWINDNANEQ